MWEEMSWNKYDFSNMTIGERMYQEEYDENRDDEDDEFESEEY